VAETVKRVNVTLPVEQVERIKALMSENPDDYPTVSSFVTQAIADRLANEAAHAALIGVLRDLGGEPTAEDQRWAEEALRRADQAAAEHTRKQQGAA